MRRGTRLPGVAGALAAAVLVAAGCRGGETAAKKEAPNVIAMTLESPAFGPGHPVPVESTCDGANRSPELQWSALPPGTQSLAVSCEDPDAPGKTWVHWVLYDLPASTRLPAGIPATPHLRRRGVQRTNDFGTLGYGGPCPPRGKAHRYVFRVAALDDRLGLPSGRTLAEVRRAMAGHVLGEGELTGTYARP
jgi:Raf kinase inhibitor-like YbhB/YbcL family protein